MTHPFRLFHRKSGVFFIEDRTTRRQESLRTKDKEEALRLFHAQGGCHESRRWFGA